MTKSNQLSLILIGMVLVSGFAYGLESLPKITQKVSLLQFSISNALPFAFTLAFAYVLGWTYPERNDRPMQIGLIPIIIGPVLSLFLLGNFSPGLQYCLFMAGILATIYVVFYFLRQSMETKRSYTKWVPLASAVWTTVLLCTNALTDAGALLTKQWGFMTIVMLVVMYAIGAFLQKEIGHTVQRDHVNRLLVYPIIKITLSAFVLGMIGFGLIRGNLAQSIGLIIILFATGIAGFSNYYVRTGKWLWPKSKY